MGPGFSPLDELCSVQELMSGDKCGFISLMCLARLIVYSPKNAVSGHLKQFVNLVNSFGGKAGVGEH